MLHGSLDGRGVWGRIDTGACMVEPLCRSPETITGLLMIYTPVQNKKLKKNTVPLLYVEHSVGTNCLRCGLCNQVVYNRVALSLLC